MGRSYTPNSGYTSYTLQQRYERILDADGNHYTSPYVNVDTSPSYNGSVVRKAEGVSPYRTFGFNVLDALEESITKSHDVSIRPFVSLQARFLKCSNTTSCISMNGIKVRVNYLSRKILM